MKPFFRMLLATIAFALVVAGCSQTIADFTIISTREVDVGGKYRRLNFPSSGEDSGLMVLFIPLGIPTWMRAIDRCLESANGDFLTEAVFESSYWTIGFVTKWTFSVRGTVWVRATSSDLRNPDIELFELHAEPPRFKLVSTRNPERALDVYPHSSHQIVSISKSTR